MDEQMTPVETIITDFTTNASRYGYVARFRLRIGEIMTIEDVALLRPREDPTYVHVVLPKNEKGRSPVIPAPWLRTQVNKQAAAMYTAATGIKVAGSSQRTEERPKTVPVVDPDQPVEDDAAGLRRVIGETMEAAGL